MVIFNCCFNSAHSCFISFYNAIKDFDNKRATGLSAHYFMLLKFWEDVTVQNVAKIFTMFTTTVWQLFAA